MKRLALVFLMLLLSLQSAWAAAGAYCQHEQDAAVQHFGHHAHQHQAADKSDAGGGPASTFHGDCPSCHLGGVGAVTSVLDVPSPAPASPAVASENDFLLSVFLEGPERPKWASPA